MYSISIRVVLVLIQKDPSLHVSIYLVENIDKCHYTLVLSHCVQLVSLSLKVTQTVMAKLYP